MLRRDKGASPQLSQLQQLWFKSSAAGVPKRNRGWQSLERKLSPPSWLDGVTVIAAPRRSPQPPCGGNLPPLPSHCGLGSRGCLDKRFAWGKTAGLTERREEPSLLWFISKHF